MNTLGNLPDIKRCRTSLATAGLILVSLAVFLLTPRPAFAAGAGIEVPEPVIPPGVDVFNLNLDQTKAISASKNFEVVGQSYFKGPWLTPAAQASGLGAGLQTPRVHNGVAYLAGYPPSLFGVLVAYVAKPSATSMPVLSFIPCNAGTRCNYLRVNNDKKILIGTHDTSGANPMQPPVGQPVQAGVTFYDVSNPAKPQLLGFYLTRANGGTHGFEIDDRYVYACATTPQSKPGSTHELVILDYSDPRNPTLASTLHIQGQHVGETYEPQNQLKPDGTPQIIMCHEINLHNNRLYISWRDAGMIIVDVTDRTHPAIISELDYVPPYNGGHSPGGAAHTSAPVIVAADQHPKLVVQTDEIFDCPPGFGRIIDISALVNPQIISNYRLPFIDDNYDFNTGQFVCRAGQQSIHQPWFDYRSPSLFYQSWYDQGVRAWDISNPFAPVEVGYYLSPRYQQPPGVIGRQTRETYQDPDTGLIYMTDGNGGGLTILRWTGPIPAHPPISGAR
jgi:hypothetical protein